MALGAIVLGAALGYASIKFKVEGDPLVEKIDAILPQTQCGQCGFPGCKPYATAIAAGQIGPNASPVANAANTATANDWFAAAIARSRLPSELRLNSVSLKSRRSPSPKAKSAIVRAALSRRYVSEPKST